MNDFIRFLWVIGETRMTGEKLRVKISDRFVFLD